MLERDRVRSASILLVSDLETAPDDVPSLARTIDLLRRSSIELRVFGLAPSSDARLLFEGFLQDEAFAAPAAGEEEAPADTSVARRPPLAFVLLGMLFFLVLAAHERFAGRLAITRGEVGS
jgi:hypothetical protein